MKVVAAALLYLAILVSSVIAHDPKAKLAKIDSPAIAFRSVDSSQRAVAGWPYASDKARSGDCCHCCFDEGTPRYKCYNMERSACERSRGRCVVKILCE